MFLWLSKILPQFVYPVGLILVLLTLALFLRRRPRLQNALIALALVALWVGGTRHVAARLVYSLESRYPPLVDAPQADVIIVLGSGVRAPFPPRVIPEVSEAGDRLIYAAWLYKQGKAPHILVSGGAIEWKTPKLAAEAEIMRDLLVLLGVPREAVWLEPKARNTYENARFSARILEEKGVKRALLVTSAIHMPRSARLFRKQGVDVIPAPTDYIVTEGDFEFLRRPDIRTQIYLLIPDARRLVWTEQALKEYMGLLVYRLRGWI